MYSFRQVSNPLTAYLVQACGQAGLLVGCVDDGIVESAQYFVREPFERPQSIAHVVCTSKQGMSESINTPVTLILSPYLHATDTRATRTDNVRTVFCQAFAPLVLFFAPKTKL